MKEEYSEYLITQTLLSSWLYSLASEEGTDEFIKKLNRENVPQSKAALDGIRFENVLNSVLQGEKLPEDHEWYEPITELAASEWIKGGQSQVKLSRSITVNGVNILLFGVLDFLKEGVITDTKYSKSYKYGKYLGSPQHSLYFALVPEARRFDYKVCDGKNIYTESYYPEETLPIERLIAQFISYLHTYGYWDTFAEKWRAKK